MNFCTLFDSNYIDRGLALYHSLESTTSDFKLFIFCFDEKTFDILDSMKLKFAVLISEDKILDKTLTEIKKKRRHAEYCWTCTPIIIEYVLKEYHVDECTYVDADIFFFKSPQVLLDEFHSSKCSVSVIGHRFPDNFAKKKWIKFYGEYCVEFNTFCNDSNGLKVLQWWKEKCLESCTMDLYKDGFGDQKYLSGIMNKYNFVHETIHKGAGVAPWNLSDYRLNCITEDGSIEVCYKKKEVCSMVFYHYQNLDIISEDKSNIGVYNEIGKLDDKLISFLYTEYINIIWKIRHELQTVYDFSIPQREKRSGEVVRKFTGLRDEFVYIWQSLVIIRRGEKNIFKNGMQNNK